MDKTLERAWNLTPEQREEYSKYLMPAYRKQGGFPLRGFIWKIRMAESTWILPRKCLPVFWDLEMRKSPR